MLKAKKARGKVMSMETAAGKQEKVTIEKAVTEAVKKGCLSVIINFEISTAAVAWLESLGYRVKTNRITLISWSE